MIDTLSYTRDLMKAGLSEEQAELMVRSQFSMISNNVATKADLAEIRNEIKDIRNEIKDIRIDIKAIELRLIKSLGGLMIFLFGAMAAVQAFYLNQIIS